MPGERKGPLFSDYIRAKVFVMKVKPLLDRVLIKYTGTEVKIDGEEYTIVKQSDILAVVE